MHPRFAEFSSPLRRRPWRGVAAVALLAVAPKCVLCLAGWLGLGTLVGLGGPEICGGAEKPGHADTVALLAAAALASVIIGSALRTRRRKGACYQAPST